MKMKGVTEIVGYQSDRKQQADYGMLVNPQALSRTGSGGLRVYIRGRRCSLMHFFIGIRRKTATWQQACLANASLALRMGDREGKPLDKDRVESRGRMEGGHANKISGLHARLRIWT